MEKIEEIAEQLRNDIILAVGKAVVNSSKEGLPNSKTFKIIGQVLINALAAHAEALEALENKNKKERENK